MALKFLNDGYFAGKVGIGTLSPSTRLHLDQSSNDRAGGLYIERNASNYGLSMFVNSGGYGVIGSNGTFTTDILTLDLNLGNVGIGTGSPTQKLHVAGNLRVTGAYYDSNNAPGTLDQILTSTATGVAWVDPGTITAEAATLVVIECKNTSGATITKGTPVYQTGTVGATEVIEIAPADALISSGKQPAIGLLQTTLNNNGLGKVVITGEFLNFTTDPIDGVTPTTGDKVFLKSGGGLTLTKPTGAGNGIQNLGLIGKVSSGNAGSITVSSIMRTNDVPNLPTGKIWVGDGNTIVSDTIFLDEPNGRVGIGTTSPSVQLDIEDSSNVIVDMNTTTANANTTIRLQESGSVKATIGYDGTNDGLILTTGGFTAGNGIFIDDSQNVGIGTTNPVRKLHIQDTTGNPQLVIGDGASVYSSIQSSDSLYINAGEGGGGSTTIFRRGTSFTESMRIDSSGNVGIGTTNPIGKLNVSKDSTTDGLSQAITVSSSSVTTKRMNLGYVPGSNYAFIDVINYSISNTDQALSLQPNGGNVGIGTTSPDNLLHVQGSNNPRIDLGEDTNNKGWMRWNNADNYIDFTTRVGGTYYADTLVLRNGNVGIGTTSPNRTLQVNSGGANIVATFESSDTLSRISFVDSNTSSDSIVQIGAAGNELVLFAGGAEHVRVDSTGNVGIGTTAPSQKLHVAGNLRVTGAYYDSNNSPGAANQVLVSTVSGTDWIDGSAIPGVPAGSGAAGQVTVWSGTDVITGYTRFQVYDAGGQIQITDGTRDIRINSGYSGSIAMIGTSSSHDLGFMTGNSQRVTIDTSGNVGIGTTSPNAYSNQTTLTINGSTYGRIDLESGGTLRSSLFSQAANTSLTVDTGFFSLDTGGSERMRITSTGNVGIGVTNPSDYYPTANDLVLGGNANNGMTIASTNVGAIHFADGSTGAAEYAGYIAYQHSDNKMRFGVNESDKLVILSGGNVGIGTTLPGSKLTVSGSFSADTGFFSNELTLTSNLRLQSNITILNKAQTSYISFATRNTSGSEAVMDLTNVGSINGGAAGPYLALAGNTTATAMTGDIFLANQKQVRFLTSGNLVGLRLQSSGTSSFIDNEVGDMYFRQEADGNNIFFQADDGSGGNTTYFSVRPNNGARTQFEKNTRHNDGIKAFFGTGEDLQIYHDGTNSHIDQNVSGNLYIKNSIVDGDILFQGDDGSGTAVTNYFTINGGGGETRFQKNTRHNDGVKAQFGNSDDLQIYHDNTNSYSAVVDVGTGYLLLGTDGPFVLIGNSTATETYIKANNNSSVDLYFDNSKKFETTSVGVTVTGDADVSSTVLVGTNNSIFAENNLRFKSAGSAFIDHNTVSQSIKFRLSNSSSLDIIPLEITPSYLSSSVDMYFGDNDKIRLGASSDLQIYHDSSDNNSYIKELGSGSLQIWAKDFEVYNADGTETLINADVNAGVQLYFDNSPKIATTSTGVTVTGKGTSSATITSDGSSTLTTKGYVDSLITGATIYRGTWDPDVSLNSGYGSPDLSGVTQTSGYYYICSADGAATPNGATTEPNTWNTGDWVIWNDDVGTSGEWQKIDNSSVLSGVGTGQTVALWQGASSVTDSETLGNAPITVSGNNTTFAGSIYANTIYSATNSAYYIDVNATAVGLNMAGDINLAAGKKLQYSANSFMTPENNVSGAEISTAGTFIVKTGSTPTLGLTLDASQNATFAGDVSLADNKKLTFGTAPDFEIYHNSTTNVNHISSLLSRQLSISADNTTFTGDVTLTNGKLTVTHDTNNAAKIIQTATSMSNSTYTFEVDSSSHTSNMSAAGAMAVDVNSGRAFTIVGNGNVGIGTASPGAKLDVNGATYVRSVIYGYAGGGNQYGGLSWNGTDEGFLFLKDSNVTKVYINSNGDSYLNGGNVGIGTTSPGTLHSASYGTTRLHIDGGTDRGQMIIEGDTFAAIVLSDNGTTANQRVFATNVNDGKYTIKPLNDNGTSTVGGEAVTVLHGGNVGIGTTSPDAILETSKEVDGNQVGALLTNTRQAGTADSVSLNFGLGRTADGYIRSVDAIKLLKEQQWTGTPSTVDAALVFSTVSNETVSERARITSTGHLQVSTGYFELTSQPTTKLWLSTNQVQLYAGNLLVFGGYNASNDAVIIGNESGDINVTLAGGANDKVLYLEGSSGNVGIGTKAPLAKLHSVITTAGDSALKLQDDTGSVFDFQCGIAGVTGDALVIKDTTLSYDYLTLRSGNVGIGTTSPQSGGGAANWLSLNGTAAYSGGVVYTIGSVTKAYSYFESDYLKQQAQGGYGQKFIVDGTNTAMTILSGGNVGIGTTSPQSKLQVAGGIQMADDTDTASAAKVGTMRYRTGTEYVEVTGTELVTNGDFATDTDWTKATGWTISGGKAIATSANNGADILQNVGLVSGTTYKIEVTISGYSAGSLRMNFLGTGGQIGDFTANGTYIGYAVGGSDARLQIVATTTTTTLSIDNVSVIEVTAEDASYADMCMQTGSSTYEWVNIVRNTY